MLLPLPATARHGRANVGVRLIGRVIGRDDHPLADFEFGDTLTQLEYFAYGVRGEF